MTRFAISTVMLQVLCVCVCVCRWWIWREEGIGAAEIWRSRQTLQKTHVSSLILLRKVEKVCYCKDFLTVSWVASYLDLEETDRGKEMESEERGEGRERRGGGRGKGRGGGRRTGGELAGGEH